MGVIDTVITEDGQEFSSLTIRYVDQLKKFLIF